MLTSASVALTPEQQAAVEAAEGPWVLAAPPGSGKTEVLVRRTIWLLEQSPEEMFRVLGLTYTTKAADELRARVQEALGDESWRVTATTFHSFCLDMLTHHGGPVEVPPNAVVYDDDLRGHALLDALRDVGLLAIDDDLSADSRTVKSCLDAIDRLRVDLIPPDLAPDEPCGQDLSVREVYDAYDRALEAAGALDFSSMLFKAHRLLVEDPWVAEHYRRLYRHVLVDEAHDLNRVQYEVLRSLFLDSRRNVFVVADDDQEIFSFAGASSRYVRRFSEEFEACQLPLSTNFRSAHAIVDAAERLKSHFSSPRPPKPPMVPATPAPGWVRAWSFEDEESEAVAVVDWVQRILVEGLPGEWLHEGEDPGVPPERVGIIGRTRFAFDHLTDQLSTRELPHVVRTEEGGLFDSDVARAVYFGLRVIANPHDRVSRQRLLAHLGGQTGASGVAGKAPSSYGSGQQQPTELLRALGADGALPEGVAHVLADRADSLDELLDGLTNVELQQPEFDETTAELWRRDQKRIESWWTAYAATTDPGERDLAGFLRHLARLQRTAATDPGIRLLTPFRAKGLQFRAVAVVGMNEGTFPFYRAVHEEEIDQERRALYVAATRAERALLLTRPRLRITSWGKRRAEQPSRFIEEFGIELQSR